MESTLADLLLSPRLCPGTEQGQSPVGVQSTRFTRICPLLRSSRRKTNEPRVAAMPTASLALGLAGGQSPGLKVKDLQLFWTQLPAV